MSLVGNCLVPDRSIRFEARRGKNSDNNVLWLLKIVILGGSTPSPQASPRRESHPWTTSTPPSPPAPPVKGEVAVPSDQTDFPRSGRGSYRPAGPEAGVVSGGKSPGAQKRGRLVSDKSVNPKREGTVKGQRRAARSSAADGPAEEVEAQWSPAPVPTARPPRKAGGAPPPPSPETPLPGSTESLTV